MIQKLNMQPSMYNNQLAGGSFNSANQLKTNSSQNADNEEKPKAAQDVKKNDPGALVSFYGDDQSKVVPVSQLGPNELGMYVVQVKNRA